MTVVSPSFLLGASLLVYLSTFLLFAIIRIVTGVSIQRIGLSGLRRIAFSPREGLRIDIRGLHLSFHRSTLAQPTWITIRISELKIAIDLTLFGRVNPHWTRARGWRAWRGSRADPEPETPSIPAAKAGPTPELGSVRGRRPLKLNPPPRRRFSFVPTTARPATKIWERLAKLREKLKAIHRQIFWLRLFDVVAVNTSVELTDIGVIQLASLTLDLISPQKKGDPSRPDMVPAEWIGTVRGLYLIPVGSDGTELLHNGTVNIGGTLGPGLRNASIALKLGRVTVPIDDIRTMIDLAKRARQTMRGENAMSGTEDMSASEPETETEVPAEPELGEDEWESRASSPKSADETHADDDTVSEPKPAERTRDAVGWPAFVDMLLKSVVEIQFAVSSVEVTKLVRIGGLGTDSTTVSVAMKELGIDLIQLDRNSPTHLTHFPRGDTAHQALIAAISVTVGVVTEKGQLEQVLSVPMLTATVRTTLPSKFVELATTLPANLDLTPVGPPIAPPESILVASLVVTSPSVDVDPHHVPVIGSVIKAALGRTGRRHHSYGRGFGKGGFGSLGTLGPDGIVPGSAVPGGLGANRPHGLMSRLLPRASVRTSIHEPVIRVVLPPAAPDAPSDAFDLLIGTMTSVGFDIGSNHTGQNGIHYAVNSVLRVSSAQLYYQTYAGNKHRLFVTDSLDVKTQVSAGASVCVVTTASVRHCGIHLVRPEIGRGIRQIIFEFGSGKTTTIPTAATMKENLLRKMPVWLASAQLQCIDFSAEVAGFDPVVSHRPKGLAVHVEQWSVHYRAEPRTDDGPTRGPRRRGSSRVAAPDDFLWAGSGLASPTSPRRHIVGFAPTPRPVTDGRRAVLTVGRLAVYVITGNGYDDDIGGELDDDDGWDPVPLVSVPQAEVVVETKTDGHGPVCSVTITAEAAFIRYNLFRHYTIIVALAVLKETFGRDRPRTDPGINPQTVDAPTLYPFSAPTTGFPIPRPHGQSWPEVVVVGFASRFVQVLIDGPTGLPVLFQVHDLEAERGRWTRPSVRMGGLRLCVPTPRVPGTWSRVVDIRRGRADIGPNRDRAKAVDITAERVRLCVPDQMVVYKLIDNLVTLVKTVKELPYRIPLTGWPRLDSEARPDETVPLKPPQPPIVLPAISVTASTVLVEVEDGPFEWRLGLIYRAGLVEQTQRLAREAAFKHKAIWVDDSARRATAAVVAAAAANAALASGTAFDAGAETTNPDRADRAERKRRRARSSGPRQGFTKTVPTAKRSTSARAESRARRRHWTDEPAGVFSARYAPDEENSLFGPVTREYHNARTALDMYHSFSWKLRIDQAIAEVNRTARDRSEPYPVPVFADEALERVLAIPARPALLTVLTTDVAIDIGPPSFGPDGLVDFLYRMGKGMPRDMQYSLLVPMHIRASLGSANARLRDYPLPLLDVPAPAGLEVDTDFVIAEEHRNRESVRWVRVEVVPPELTAPTLVEADSAYPVARGLAVVVPRTVAPVKSYSDMVINIRSGQSTKLAWANSYQAAIQDLMQVVEGFTRPPIDRSDQGPRLPGQRPSLSSDDPSNRMGFWDKIRLTFHSRMRIRWTNGGDLQLALKGSRDPYSLTGDGAGFVFCWQDDVRWRVGDGPPEEFMVIDSGIFLLAVPDFGALLSRIEGRDSNDQAGTDQGLPGRTGGETVFAKTVMKLTGRVRWQAGLVFERKVDSGGRSFKFIPHYEVVVKHPDFVPLGSDVFDGFRSSFIHGSFAISATAPPGTSDEAGEVMGYNSIHLSPGLFSHFFSWWALFSGVMSLPIRQGSLWPGPARSSKKLGRHLETIKYSLVLEPVYMSHVYRHADVTTPADVAYSAATGLKVRVGRFGMEMHQRREVIRKAPVRVGGKDTEAAPTTGMRIHKARVDCEAADLRAIEARMYCADLDDTVPGTRPAALAGPTSISVADRDMTWIDMDDFCELDWIAITETNMMTNVVRLMHAPRLTYFRETDRGQAGSATATTAFGRHEASDPRRVQAGLVAARREEITEQIRRLDRRLGDTRLRKLRLEISDLDANKEIADLVAVQKDLVKKSMFLKEMQKVLLRQVGEETELEGDGGDDDGADDASQHPSSSDGAAFSAADYDGMLADFVSDFDNRFIVHNGRLKWNNSLRNIILRYSHQISHRRGLVYYASRRAVRFLLDIVDEQRARQKQDRNRQRSNNRARTATDLPRDHGDVEIAGLDKETADALDDMEGLARKFVQGGADSDNPAGRTAAGSNPSSKPSLELTAVKSYHVRLIAPQIQLQSERNLGAAVVATATNMQLEVIQIMDRARMLDDVTGLIQRRYSAIMEKVQIFVTDERLWERDIDRIGGAPASYPAGPNPGRRTRLARDPAAWPPWVPLEVMFGFPGDPAGFMCVVQRTTAEMRYDKYNTLRVGSNGHGGNAGAGGAGSNSGHPSPMNRIWIGFPPLLATCDSAQYYAVYIIVLDLLLYAEPLEKDQKAKLDRILLASDFEDLSDVPGTVSLLQDRLRNLASIRSTFLARGRSGAMVTADGTRSSELGPEGWKALRRVDADLARVRGELFFMIKAIAAFQRRRDKERGRAEAGPAMTSPGMADDSLDDAAGIRHWTIQAAEIEWSLIRGQAGQTREPLVRMRLQGARYDRVDRSDGSNRNDIAVGVIEGENRLPNAFYRHMIGAYDRGGTGSGNALGPSPAGSAASFQPPAAQSQAVAAAAQLKVPTPISPPVQDMVRVKWYVFEAIGGIPIIYQFEAEIVPLRVQVEREVGMKLFEYIFPAVADVDADMNDDDDAAADTADTSMLDEDGEVEQEEVADGTDPFPRDSVSSDEESGSDSPPTRRPIRAGRMFRTIGTGVLARLGSAATTAATDSGLAPGPIELTGSFHGGGAMDASATTTTAPATGMATSDPPSRGRAEQPSEPSPPRRRLGARTFTLSGFMSRGGGGGGGGTDGDDSQSIRSRMSGHSRAKSSHLGDNTTDTTERRSRLKKRRTIQNGDDAASVSATRPRTKTKARLPTAPKPKPLDPNDELAQMMDRAGRYRTLASVRIPAVTLCVSYRGKGQFNWEDVHDLVVKMPTLEYTNKIWSNYDLAMQLRREVRNVLISHAGAIIGNKFRRHDDGPSLAGSLGGSFVSSTVDLANFGRSATMAAGDGDQKSISGASESALSALKSGLAGVAGKLRLGGPTTSTTTTSMAPPPLPQRPGQEAGSRPTSRGVLGYLHRQRPPTGDGRAAGLGAAPTETTAAVPTTTSTASWGRRGRVDGMPAPTPSGYTPASATPNYSAGPGGLVYPTRADPSHRHARPGSVSTASTMSDGRSVDYQSIDGMGGINDGVDSRSVDRQSIDNQSAGNRSVGTSVSGSIDEGDDRGGRQQASPRGGSLWSRISNGASIVHAGRNREPEHTRRRLGLGSLGIGRREEAAAPSILPALPSRPTVPSTGGPERGAIPTTSTPAALPNNRQPDPRVPVGPVDGGLGGQPPLPQRRRVSAIPSVVTTHDVPAPTNFPLTGSPNGPVGPTTTPVTSRMVVPKITTAGMMDIGSSGGGGGVGTSPTSIGSSPTGRGHRRSGRMTPTSPVTPGSSGGGSVDGLAAAAAAATAAVVGGSRIPRPVVRVPSTTMSLTPTPTSMPTPMPMSMTTPGVSQGPTVLVTPSSPVGGRMPRPPDASPRR